MNININIRDIECFLLDMDGTIYLGVETIRDMQLKHISYRF